MSERVTSPNPEAEAFKIAAYGYLRSQHLEPPATQRLRRLLRLAVGQREERLVRETAAQLSSFTWTFHALRGKGTNESKQFKEAAFGFVVEGLYEGEALGKGIANPLASVMRGWRAVGAGISL